MAGLYMLIICWIAAVRAQGTGLVSSWTTSTGGSIYLNRLLNLKCEGIDVHDITESKPDYSIQFTDINQVQCSYLRAWILSKIILPQGIVLQNVVTKSYCETLPETDVFSITLNVTRELSSYKDTICKYVDESGETSKPFDLPTIQEAPENLRLVLSPEVVIEGSPFTVECMSDGAVPASSFVYEIFESESWRELSQATYTPTIADRSGLSVRCRDTAHPNWDIASDITKSVDKQPAYIDVGGDGNDAPAVSLNPDYNTNTLTCNIIAHTGAVISYTWRSSVESENGVTTRELILSPRKDVQDEVTEAITCVGSVDGLSTSRNLTWTITWNKKTTTTQTPNTSTPQKSKAGIYIGVAAAVVGVAIIVIIVVVCWRKHKAAATGNKCDRDLALNENGESKPKPQGRGQTPSKHSKDSTPLNQQHNDKPEIIYSDVQAINKPHPNTAMEPTEELMQLLHCIYEQLQMPVSDGVYSQPDEHLYSGLMKRTQIQPTNQRDTTEASSDYVNCSNLTPQ